MKKEGSAMMKTALTIAGSDCSGGAGLQADLKTFSAHGVFGMSVIVSVVAENTRRVIAAQDIPPDMIARQMDAVFEDMPVDAVKVGMLSSPECMEAVAAKLRQYRPRHVVIDPVMYAKNGCPLMDPRAVGTLVETILPLAGVLTPNIPEAEILSGRKIGTPEDMTRAARAIGEAYGCAVLCKGGHQVSDANDFLWQPGGEGRWFRSRRVDNPNTHGTGCTLSSAIASNLAKGFDLETAVRRSKDYIFGALSAQLNLGRGSGPMDHMWDLRSRFTGGRADL